MAKTRMHARVTGRVQGVFFRDYTAREAIRLGLSGWVRNRDDGSVEVEFQGIAEDISRMINWLHRGSPMSQVTGVETASRTEIPEERGFEVKY